MLTRISKYLCKFRFQVLRFITFVFILTLYVRYGRSYEFLKIGATPENYKSITPTAPTPCKANSLLFTKMVTEEELLEEIF